jgi:hypothetical protein
LTGRKQRVKSNDKFSQWLDVEAGVIQGSVLGPIVFIIFISDINSYIPPTIELTKYADDLGAHNNYIDQKDDNIQLAVDGVEKWAIENDMQINTIVGYKPTETTRQHTAHTEQPDSRTSNKLQIFRSHNQRRARQ